MSEFHRRDRFAAAFLVIGALTGSIPGTAGSVRADRITLHEGQSIKGKLMIDKAHPNQYLLICEVGKTPMVIKKDQVVSITPEKSALDEYVVRLDKERTSADEDYALGVWCEEQNLKDLAWVHYDHAVKRDSTFEPAHRKLGHVLLNGRWLNDEEVKEAQGMVKFQGRWMLPEEKERREQLTTRAAEGSAWAKKLRLLRDAYLAPQQKRSEEAERRLLAISEPIAVGPVLKILCEDPTPAVRAIGSKVLGGISGSEATHGLIGRFLVEEDESVRQVTMTEIARREPSEVVPLLTRSLRSTHHQVVNRSGWGLGNLNVQEVVPKLITALITVEQEVVMVEVGGGASTSGYPGGGQLFGSTTSAIPILTPPAVGAGTVAYGATSIPGNAIAGSPFSLGMGGSRSTVPKLVPIEYRNEEVLKALVKLTGRNFGYDIATWKQWLATSFQVDAPPTRRVPEP